MACVVCDSTSKESFIGAESYFISNDLTGAGVLVVIQSETVVFRAD